MTPETAVRANLRRVLEASITGLAYGLLHIDPDPTLADPVQDDAHVRRMLDGCVTAVLDRALTPAELDSCSIDDGDEPYLCHDHVELQDALDLYPLDAGTKQLLWASWSCDPAPWFAVRKVPVSNTTRALANVDDDFDYQSKLCFTKAEADAWCAVPMAQRLPTIPPGEETP